MKVRYAGAEPIHDRRPKPDAAAAYAVPDTQTADALRQAEHENERVRHTVCHLEGALRTAGKVLQPYLVRTIGGSTRGEK